MKIFHPQFILILFLIFTNPFNAAPQDKKLITKQIDSLLSASYPAEKPGASIIVISDHNLLFKSSYGLSDLEDSRPNTTETIFRIGSVTKQFTAIGVLIMLSEQKLSLSDPVSKYYPELFSNKQAITLKQLLSHTSGVKDLSEIKAIRPLMTDGARPYKLIEIISREELNFEPGEKYEYSNSAYVILGGILEKVSGQSYAEFLSARILSPLGMNNTYYANRSEIPETSNTSSGYFSRSENYVNAPDINTSILFSAGGLWSTVEDMATWNEALYTNKLLDPVYIKLAFTPNNLNSGQSTDYGFGFRICQVNGVPSIEHGGGVFGYSSYGIRIEKYGVYVMILSNFERDNKYDELAAQIAAIAQNKPYNYSVLEMNSKDLEKFVGRYLRNDGDTIHVEHKNKELTISKNKKNEQTLKPIGENTFLIGDQLDDKITFITGNNKGLVWKPRRALGIEATKID